MYVRYAWTDDPVNPNLFNKEGLPASPFRTDK
jgi:sialate O-acetylesterase